MHIQTHTLDTIVSASTEPALGWQAMPAYGEVMSGLLGLNHLDIHEPLAPEPRANNLLIESFWSTLGRQTMMEAA